MEKQLKQILVIGLTQRVLEPMIYLKWGQHANYYTNDAVLGSYKVDIWGLGKLI